MTRPANDVEVYGDVARLRVDSRTYGTMAILVDVDRLPLVSHLRWSVRRHTRKKSEDGFYAQAYVRGSALDGDERWVQIHRLLMSPVPAGMQVDHINCDGLDNRLANLRLVTQQANGFNHHAAKGCYWHHGRWSATIGVNRKTTYLGRFATQEEARAAYLAAKERLHGVRR